MSCILQVLWFLAKISPNESRFKTFALLESILNTPKLLNLSCDIVNLRHVFTSFSAEKLQEAVLAWIETAILYCLKGSMENTSFTALEGLCMPLCIFLCKII